MLTVLFTLVLQLLQPRTGPTPMATSFFPSEKLTDRAIEKRLRAFDTPGALKSGDRYFYNHVDLDGSGEPEVLVYLFSTGYCSPGGCDLLVLRKDGDDYEVVSDIGLAWIPVVVSSGRTNGWRDLILWNANFPGEPSHYVVLKFDGKSYPQNPMGFPASSLTEPVTGIAYLNNPRTAEFGVLFR